MISFEHDESRIGPYGTYGKAEYTPVYMLKDRGKYYVTTIKKPQRGDIYDSIDYHNSLNKTNAIKTQLLETEGKYCCFYGKNQDPFEFLKWVQEENYTLEVYGTLMRESADGYVIFLGNLVEYSAAFKYQIYDQDLITRLKAIIEKMPKRNVGG